MSEQPIEPQKVESEPPRNGREPEGKCLVVFGTKGGVGKTALTANLGVCLAARSRKPVCLVDLDLTAAGDLARMLGLTPSKAIVDLAPVLKRPTPPAQLSLEGLAVTNASGVHLIQALTNPRQAHLLEPKLLRMVFSALRSEYAYVLIDGGKGLTDPLIEAFDATNLILLVATPDVIALYQTKWAMNIIESLLFPIAMVKAVLNRAESRGGVGSEDVRLAIPCEVIAEIPSDGRAVGLAVNQGASVVKLYPFSRVAEAFRNLADTLIEHPELFLPHQAIPRHHQRADGKPQPSANAGGGLTGTVRLFMAAEEAESHSTDDEIVVLKRRLHERLVDELDLKKMDISVLSNQERMQDLRERCERVIANLLSRELGGIISSNEIRSRLVKEVTDEALGLGPLEELLADSTITDILVNNKDRIYVERRGKLELTNKKFISNEQVRAVIERIVAPLGRRIDEANPMVDARLPDGSRVNAVIPPLSLKGPVLSIRKFVGVRYSHEDLVRLGSLTTEMLQFIRASVLARKNLIVSGGTGSGKTTMLNIVSQYIPSTERIVTLEDAAELRLVQDHWVSLEARLANVEGKGSISIRDLFRNVLRMRPDRVIIGECRGGETLDMLQAMNTGHDGSMTTIHANSPKDVASRLDSMVLMSNVELPVRAIREMIASAIHLIMHTARYSDGSRKVVSISELIGMEEGLEITFRDIFRFQQTGVAPDGTVLGQYVATGTLPTFLDELRVKGIPVDESIFCSPLPS